MASGSVRSVRAMFELTDRKYIVTGGGQGIGYAVVHAICEMGGDVAVLDIVDKPLEDLDAVAKKFNRKVTYHQADVSIEESLRSAFAAGLKALGGLDGVFTSAGIAIDKPFTEQSWAEVEKIQKVNVLGTFFTAQMAADEFKKQNKPGSIVTVSSITAHCVLPGYRMTGYNASKGGVKMLTSALAVELGPKNIRVNAIAPAFTDTAQTKAARDVAHPEAVHHMYNAAPLKRIGTVNDIVGAAIYLLSDASAYTTGCELTVTGGIHLGRSTDHAMYE
ncbi:NAD(P)-binding protein [Pseudovirgaria hyperparasitica]|uniref:NAD(P)-binding protein n=1 Tax=Pseudovirgaria hyperparasitica TaxID=470096 RepID=A0A6A6W4D1_9PEZI|nr:NAD(P)-binding protein [Pseudovirgaria hyperparasitica]KAF2757415.1 NAD(P)-binding protein [Pseudovirgaria hyperparasitica]